MKIEVTMNYDGNKQEIIEVPKGSTNSEIKTIIKKKFGIYDVKDWRDITDEKIKEPKTIPQSQDNEMPKPDLVVKIDDKEGMEILKNAVGAKAIDEANGDMSIISENIKKASKLMEEKEEKKEDLF